MHIWALLTRSQCRVSYTQPLPLRPVSLLFWKEHTLIRKRNISELVKIHCQLLKNQKAKHLCIKKIQVSSKKGSPFILKGIEIAICEYTLSALQFIKRELPQPMLYSNLGSYWIHSLNHWTKMIYSETRLLRHLCDVSLSYLTLSSIPTYDNLFYLFRTV